MRDINDKFPHWFNARFKEFSSQPERLPFDQDCLVGLYAPRPVLFPNGRADTWINPDNLKGDFTAKELPPRRAIDRWGPRLLPQADADSLLRETLGRPRK